MKSYLLICFCIYTGFGIGQNVTPSCEWTTVGLPPQKEQLDSKIVDFDKLKAQLDPESTDDEVLKVILSDKVGHLTIKFSENTYSFYEQIKLPSHCTLQGAGEGTKLIFDLVKEQDPILAQGRLTKDTVKLRTGMGPYSDYHECKLDINELDTTEFYLLGDDDESLVESWWARGKTGQIVKILSVDTNYVMFTEEVWRIYNHDAYLIKIQPVQDVEISDLTIVNNAKTDAQTSNICFRYAYNCSVKNVHSIRSNYAHVLFEFTAHSQIDKCNFEKAHDYGNGGKAYGVALQFATSSCVVINSKFDSLRHSILLQAGANHNYIAHNESTHPYWTDVKLPASSAGDIVLHGNFTYANLFEFNSCQTIVIDNSHGINGPYNTFYNNYVKGYGIWQLRGSSCGPQYFINNILEGDKVRFRAKDKEYHQYNIVNGKLINSDDTKHTYKSMIQGFVRY